MRSQKLIKAMHWDRGSTSTTSSTKHKINQTAGIPCPKIEEGPEEPAENLTGSVLRSAQQLRGELMWLTTRTRPDVAYTVGVMSRLLHKRPGYVE